MQAANRSQLFNPGILDKTGADILFFRVRFKRPICELVFDNLNSSNMAFNTLYNTYFMKNTPEFEYPKSLVS